MATSDAAAAAAAAGEALNATASAKAAAADIKEERLRGLSAPAGRVAFSDAAAAPEEVLMQSRQPKQPILMRGA